MKFNAVWIQWLPKTHLFPGMGTLCTAKNTPISWCGDILHCKKHTYFLAWGHFALQKTPPVLGIYRAHTRSHQGRRITPRGTGHYLGGDVHSVRMQPQMELRPPEHIHEAERRPPQLTVRPKTTGAPSGNTHAHFHLPRWRGGEQ